jgi:hypothetical protein
MTTNTLGIPWDVVGPLVLITFFLLGTVIFSFVNREKS